LKKLNEDTFIAEAQGSVDGLEWDVFLDLVLSDDFRIRRSRPIPLQDRNEMIAHIRKDEAPAKRQVDKVVVVEDGNYGMVTSIVKLEEQSDILKCFFGNPLGIGSVLTGKYRNFQTESTPYRSIGHDPDRLCQHLRREHFPSQARTG
jgi:hypothetical protein